MRPTAFEGTLVFGLSVAVGGALWLGSTSPEYLADYQEVAILWVSVVAYVLVVAGGVRAAVSAASVGVITLLLLERFSLSPEYGAGLAGLLLGFLRGGHGRTEWRAERTLLEIALGVCALGAAYLLWDGTVLGFSLGIWAFWLAHAAWPLLDRSSEEPRHEPEDPFDAAERRARELHSTLCERETLPTRP